MLKILARRKANFFIIILFLINFGQPVRISGWIFKHLSRVKYSLNILFFYSVFRTELSVRPAGVDWPVRGSSGSSVGIYHGRDWPATRSERFE